MANLFIQLLINPWALLIHIKRVGNMRYNSLTTENLADKLAEDSRNPADKNQRRVNEDERNQRRNR